MVSLESSPAARTPGPVAILLLLGAALIAAPACSAAATAA